MLRFYFVIIVCMPCIIYYVVKIRLMMRHAEKYSEKYRYGVARNMVNITMWGSRVKAKGYGLENLPKEGGYIMYPNHQGKFDALGIVHFHDEPCSIVMDLKRSKMVLTNEFIDVLDGLRIDRDNLREQLRCMRTMADRVKAGGKFILFPEGGYNRNGNNLQEFLPGAFKAALWSKMPIVPVAVVDSYKAFDYNSLKKVTAQIHFLKPMYYEEYKDMSTKEIAECVKARIREKMEKVLSKENEK
ncbi:MAG: 1-acyl-sn-glycerol-3-phosphate acyltransferase [Lachnospiraceae bacterium]|nr:1-acyl-sn-glycerol-3-phosphate acyltransferase [Lachnospiraceae bacterium]MBQ2099570.1 1-acyl-sn-glycerol-3-phosphate acyltransferase [Lachnospiraceae bacterium]MBQ3906088.1 1-acyl-sn-glycerol-3-phosphate acyltransferase [Lachnospiraceae bacterium]